MARQNRDPARLARVDDALRDMFRTFCAQPIPGRLLSVVDQLDEPEALSQKTLKRRL
jgi:hypothetical protein